MLAGIRKIKMGEWVLWNHFTFLWSSSNNDRCIDRWALCRYNNRWCNMERGSQPWFINCLCSCWSHLMEAASSNVLDSDTLRLPLVLSLEKLITSITLITHFLVSSSFIRNYIKFYIHPNVNINVCLKRDNGIIHGRTITNPNNRRKEEQLAKERQCREKMYLKEKETIQYISICGCLFFLPLSPGRNTRSLNLLRPSPPSCMLTHFPCPSWKPSPSWENEMLNTYSAYLDRAHDRHRLECMRMMLCYSNSRCDIALAHKLFFLLRPFHFLVF